MLMEKKVLTDVLAGFIKKQLKRLRSLGWRVNAGHDLDLIIVYRLCVSKGE